MQNCHSEPSEEFKYCVLKMTLRYFALLSLTNILIRITSVIRLLSYGCMF